MWKSMHRVVLAAIAGTALLAACNNDSLVNRGVIAAGARFQLIAEQQPGPARLLLDSATGDLWRLENEAASDARWVRIASGPADAKVLKPEEMLGMRSPAS
jgi:hypothetical protein